MSASSRGAIAALAMLPLLFGGCAITITPGDNNGGDGNGDGDGTSEPVITVRIVNDSDVTLDPEIFVSADPVTVDELIQAANKYTAYGVGTLGILGPRSADEFALTCSQARVIATAGGKFGDNLNAPDGFGRRIVLTQDLSIFCEGGVTFTFTARDGEYDTTFDVDP